MVNCFYEVVLIPWLGHHDILACTPGLVMSGSDGMNSLLEYILTNICVWDPIATSFHALRKIDASQDLERAVLIWSWEAPEHA
jgi:hypothetical protein